MTTLRYGKPEEAGMSPARVEKLRHLGASWVADGTHPALVLLVARRGMIVLHEAWGKQGPEADAPGLRTDAIFRVHSISKVLTAACVMSLVDDGLMGLNRPVQEYIPEFEGEGKQEVLVHHLLTHTSGLEDGSVLPAMTAAIRTRGSPHSDTNHYAFTELALNQVYRAKLGYRAGLNMSYSTAGYLLAGELIRRVTGKWVDDFARERLFEPLGMDSTSFRESDAHRERYVARWTRTPWTEFVDAFGNAPLASSSARGTADDLAIFGQAFLQSGRYGGIRVLSAAGTREMMRNQIPGVGTTLAGEWHKEASWGYGWAVQGSEKWAGLGSLLSADSVWHSGNGGTFIWVDPSDELVCVFFSVVSDARFPSFRHTTSDLFVNAVIAAIED